MSATTNFANLYYKRTAGAAKACYICYRPTTTVLATVNTVDFLYTCDSHLADPGFAALIKDNGAVSAVDATASKVEPSEEEIRQVKEEWEERQRRKKEREAEKEKEKEKETEKDKHDAEGDKKAKKEPKKSSPTPSPPTTPASPPKPKPTHQRYTLHREIFAMRRDVHRRRRQATQAKEIAPRLPSAPQGTSFGGV